MDQLKNTLAVLEHAQNCWVVPDIQASVRFFSNFLGIVFPKPERVRAVDLDMKYYGKVVQGEWLTTQAYSNTFIELVQPLSGRSMFHDYLVNFPAGGIQHSAFRLSIDGFEKVKNHFQDQGYAIVSEVDHPIARMVFFDTYKILGVVTEIMGITQEGWKVLAQMEKK
ncbi:MAG TPA: VOC family protein [Cyclobacteriaceae bacterium]|nr:VOC family protein [Cyclobacteriaceae bacterium]